MKNVEKIINDSVWDNIDDVYHCETMDRISTDVYYCRQVSGWDFGID